MAARKPLVIGADGLSQQLQATDTISGPHAKFTGTMSTPLTISLGATQTVTLSVSPVVAGDSLAIGEDISVQPTAAIPGGLNLAWWFVSGANQVALGFTSSAVVSLPSPSIPFRITAHR